MILLVAPGGYGKTALAAEWLDTSRSAWYHPSRNAADVGAFSAGVAEALCPLVPTLRAQLDDGLLAPASPRMSGAAFADSLAPHLLHWPLDARLVIDGYDKIRESRAVDEFLLRLLETSPLRLLVTSRIRPPWATAQRLVTGLLLEIGAEQLALSPVEVETLVGNQPLEGARWLIERAEGWPALVGLARTAASAQIPEKALADILCRYISEEVLETQPSALRRFMLLAAIPAEIDAPTARDELGIANAGTELAALAAKRLLRETDPGVYRFHPLVRQVLRRRLLVSEPELFRETSERLAAVARSRKRWEEAYELAFGAGRHEDTAAILIEAERDLFAAGRLDTIERWLGPCEAMEDPSVTLVRAEFALRRGNAAETRALVEDLVTLIPEGDPRASRAWRLLAHAYSQLAQRERALSAATRALELASTSREMRLAINPLLRASIDVRPTLADQLVTELEPKANDLETRIALVCARFYGWMQNRNVRGLWQELEALLALVRLRPDPVAQIVLLGAATHLSLSNGEYRRAQQLALEAVRLVEQHAFGQFAISRALVAQAKVEIGLRRFRAAETTLARVAQHAAKRHGTSSEYRNARAKLLLARGEFAQVVGDDELRPPLDAPAYGVSEHEGLVALAHAGLGDVRATRRSSERARAASCVIEGHYYAALADAIIALRSRRKSSATPRLITELRDHSFLDALVIAYRVHPPLLAVAASEPSLRTRVLTLLREANDLALARHTGAVPAKPGAAEELNNALTPREAEVLRLLAEGLSNAAVAQRLYISESTAKLHVHNILEKLGVCSRTQAVAEAARLFAEAPNAGSQLVNAALADQ